MSNRAVSPQVSWRLPILQGYTRRYTYNQLQVRPDNSKQQIDPHILRQTNNAVPIRLVEHGYQTT